MSRAMLFGRMVNICVLREKAVLQRKVFTVAGSGKRNGVAFSDTCIKKEDEKLLLPYTHILEAPGKQIRPKVNCAFIYWLKVPADKLTVVNDTVRMLHISTLLTDDIQDNSTLRRGIPAAHSIYGIASTISASNCGVFIALDRVQSLNHSDATTVCAQKLLDLYRGQGMEMYFRDNYICPSVEEYKEYAKRKMGALFTLGVRLLQLFCENKAEFTKLTENLGLYYQISNDYRGLFLQEDNDYGEDITEGKFSFPIIHAIKSRPDDNEVIHVLRQRTRDVELKKRCVSLLEKFGSFSYTRKTLEKLDAEARAEVSKLGGNPLLEALLDELLIWKEWTYEKGQQQ